MCKAVQVGKMQHHSFYKITDIFGPLNMSFDTVPKALVWGGQSSGFDDCRGNCGEENVCEALPDTCLPRAKEKTRN